MAPVLYRARVNQAIMTHAGAKVLIVDDEADVVEVLRTFLVSLGYEVDRALHGADALMAIGVGRPDVVLLDIKMSGLDGVEVLKRVRAMDATIPVIMVTGDEDPLLIRQTREIGAYGYIVKPVELEGLRRLVAEALAASHRRGRPEVGASP